MPVTPQRRRWLWPWSCTAPPCSVRTGRPRAASCNAGARWPSSLLGSARFRSPPKTAANECQRSPMSKLIRKFFAASIAASCTLAPAVSRADKVARVVADYTVFLDPPTGFVFVKLPVGWEYVGEVDPGDVARAPG